MTQKQKHQEVGKIVVFADLSPQNEVCPVSAYYRQLAKEVGLNGLEAAALDKGLAKDHQAYLEWRSQMEKEIGDGLEMPPAAIEIIEKKHLDPDFGGTRSARLIKNILAAMNLKNAPAALQWGLLWYRM